MTVMFMTDAGRKTGDSKIDRLAMEYEDKYGQPLTEAQIERLDQLAGSPEYGDYAIDPSGFASDAPFGSPQRESELNAYMKNLQDERNAKRANFTLENLGISPDQTSPFTQPTAPQNPMQGGLGGLGSIFDIMKKQMPPPPTQNRGPILSQGPGKGRRQMPTGPISDNRMPSPIGPFENGPAPLPPSLPTRLGKGRRPIFEGGPVPLPPPTQNRGMGDIQISPIERGPDPRLMGNMSFMEFAALPVEERLRISEEGRKAIENEAIGSQPKMPPQMPDMMQQLQEALRQKQMERGTRQPMPTPRGGRGDLGGIIGRLQQQMEQRQEAPPMQPRPRPRGGLFSRLRRGIPQGRRVKPMRRSPLTKGRPVPTEMPEIEQIRNRLAGMRIRF